MDHAGSPIVEPVRCFAAAHARHDWLLFVDPDERAPAGLAAALDEVVRGDETAGAVRLPWQFYFRGRALRGTVWGSENRTKRFVVHRGRCELRPLNHRSAAVREGYRELTLDRTAQSTVVHHWSKGFCDLLEKHVRYVRHEGEALYAEGHRFGLRLAVGRPVREMRRSLVDHGGWRLGWTGVVFSVFYGVYLAACAGSLLAYQWKRRRGADVNQDDQSSSTEHAWRQAA
ncbi:MAG: hypothetical protein CMJ49_14375 [Planctomycetaceae bacterium]|nr:hypothetical protein [Planctomycetaceae bacterium]